MFCGQPPHESVSELCPKVAAWIGIHDIRLLYSAKIAPILGSAYKPTLLALASRHVRFGVEPEVQEGEASISATNMILGFFFHSF